MTREDEHVTVADGNAVVRLTGRVRLDDGARLWTDLSRHFEHGHQESIVVDLSDVDHLDASIAAILQEFRRRAHAANCTLELRGASDGVRRILAIHDVSPQEVPRDSRPASLLSRVGRSTVAFADDVRAALSFLGRVCTACVALIRQPRRFAWREIPRLLERAGADGMRIVLLLGFLMGFIMALQAEPQLARFGANIFVVDLVSLSVVRELGPLITAIIVAGRSGAAYAAELGTMKVSEEIDALRALGLDPIRTLVIPRGIALVIALPLLTIAADTVGILGGYVVSITSLGLTTAQFTTALGSALDLMDVVGGLLKSVVFAVLIVAISCQRGLAVHGGAAQVGRAATSAVVASLFALVVTDALFAWLYQALGI